MSGVFLNLHEFNKITGEVSQIDSHAKILNFKSIKTSRCTRSDPIHPSTYKTYYWILVG